jgi:hypothetical protein
MLTGAEDRQKISDAQQGGTLRIGSAMALFIACLGLAGFAVILFTEPPPAPEPVEPAGDLPEIEGLCGEVALGGMPRIQVRGDTTILVLDLDSGFYTMTQANLHLTRALEECRCELDSTVRRPDGGLSFIAARPDGSRIRIELKPSGRS